MRLPLLAVVLFLLDCVAVTAERRGRTNSILAEEDALLIDSRRNKRKLKKKDKDDESSDESSKERGTTDREHDIDASVYEPSMHPSSVTDSGDSPNIYLGTSMPTPMYHDQPSKGEVKQRKSHYSDKKMMSKLNKSDKQSYKGESSKSSSSKSSSKKNSNGKGKGKGGEMQPPSKNCRSKVAEKLLEVVPDATTKNPERCCDFDGPVGIYVTHAEPSNTTESGFEPFWDVIYRAIQATSDLSRVCFVMTGVDTSSERELSDVITDVTVLASSLPQTIAMMVTDPTANLALINEVRAIVNDLTLPNIGVFNAGYNNIVIESLVSGQDRIGYIGFMNDADFGVEAARYTKDLLDGVTAVPLCFNARPELEFVGERCAAYYTELSAGLTEPIFGVPCSIDSKVEDIFSLLVDSQANAVFSHVDCCAVVAEAVAMARSMGQSILAVGCQDADTTGEDTTIDFVTTQPILLQGYSPATWVNFPVRQALEGNDGRAQFYFPSLSSLVNTAIYTIPIV
jgi:hypothetical protein